jgi:sarcosine oxidase
LAKAKIQTVSGGAVWEHTAGTPETGETLTGDLECDVAIIGTGFTGLRAALHLAENGCHVAVFDSGDIGWGASGRNGGQVNPMLPVARPDDLRRAVGDKYFDRLAEISLGSADALFDLVRKYDIKCDARQRGWLRADHCASARKTARAAAKEWNQHGAGFEFADGAEVVRLTGSPAYRSGVFSNRGGAVQPLSLAFGLARTARAAGARIFRHAPVTVAERKGQKWHLTVAGLPVVSRQVILATNGYADDLRKNIKRSILPLTPIQIATDPLPQSVIGEILPRGTTISDTKRLIMYARREPDNRMVFGGIGYRAPFGGLGGFNWLLADVGRIFPALQGVDWRYRWGGQIALTSDHVPHFHEPEPGIIAGLGYNGRGVAMSLVMGAVLAGRALGAAPETLPIPSTKAMPMIFRDTQVFGAGIAMSWMRLQDNFECRKAN